MPPVARLPLTALTASVSLFVVPYVYPAATESTACLIESVPMYPMQVLPPAMHISSNILP